MAETADAILMVETKKAAEMESAEVLVKRDAGVRWCEHASPYAKQHGGKPWKYLHMPHDVVAESMTLDGLTKVYAHHPAG